MACARAEIKTVNLQILKVVLTPTQRSQGRQTRRVLESYKKLEGQNNTHKIQTNPSLRLSATKYLL